MSAKYSTDVNSISDSAGFCPHSRTKLAGMKKAVILFCVKIPGGIKKSLGFKVSDSEKNVTRKVQKQSKNA